MKILLIFSITLFIGIANAEMANSDLNTSKTGTPDKVKQQGSSLDAHYKKPKNLTTENMDQYPGECRIAIGNVEELCWKDGVLQNAAAGIASARDNTTGLTGMLEGASEDTQMGAVLSLKAAKACQAAIKSCNNSCVAAKVDTYLPSNPKDASDEVKAAKSTERVNNKKEATRYCTVSANKIGILADNAVRMFNQSGKLKALKTELDTGEDPRSFYEKHQTAVNMAGGAAIGLSAYNFGKSKGKSKGKKDAIAGLRYNCFNEGKWDSSECKREYLAVCSEDPKAEGCYAFTNSYCGISGNVTKAAGADTQFCDSMNAYRYCQQDGAANSPTCVEKRVQAGTCQSDKAVDPSLECQIYNHQQLAQQVCQNYPGDPLCRRVMSANTAYTTVAPAGSTASVSASTAGNSGVMGYAMSAGSNKVIPGAQRKPTSNGDVGCASCSSVFSQISRVANEYCNTGQLYGCYKK